MVADRTVCYREPVKLRSYGPCCALALAAVAAACSTTPTSEPAAPDGGAPDAGAADAEGSYPATYIEAEPQRPGDPAKGYRALVNEAYVPCGIPDSAYKRVQGTAAPGDLIEGREGRNATLPYNFTAMKTKDGVDLVTSNCLTCHAGRVNGKLFVGLGNADGDFTADAESQIQNFELLGSIVTDPKERAEYLKWKERVTVVAPYSVLSTRGPNPADGFTAALFAHHDPTTMAWSSTPLMDVPAPEDVPVDVPPWWRMKKKTSMFYVGAGRGDHARIMMTASILCTSSVEESAAIDAYFADIRAYILSIEPPKYPFAVDAALAERGRPVFEATCSRCHGTYGATPTYPNRLVSTLEIGTDPVLASGTSEFAAPFTGWFKKSFFGELARLEPKPGYVAPPLDGIWATAPYLHNGSVPTVAALLDSTQRPKYWTRSFLSTDLDQAALGWKFRVLDHGKKAETDPGTQRDLYDTTTLGYSNAGHLFGDALTPADRAAVIEYLKTL